MVRVVGVVGQKDNDYICAVLSIPGLHTISQLNWTKIGTVMILMWVRGVVIRTKK